METDRLVLRRFTEADVDSLIELDGDPEVMRFLTGGRVTPREEVERVMLPRMLKPGRWAAQDAGRFVGWFELAANGPGEASLGYRLRRPAWGRGYATEGSIAVLRKGFGEWELRRVTATTMAVNVRSRRVMEKLGMTLVRTFFEQWPEYIDGAEFGDVEYELRRERWSAGHGDR